MLPVKKIYVDSKYKTYDSKSDSNFKFELGQTCYMPEGTKFFISDCAIPHTWYTINDFNCKLYLKTEDTSSGQQNDYILTLSKKTYNGATFATELANQINIATGENPVKHFDVTTNELKLHIGALQFMFFTDNELIDGKWNGNSSFSWNPSVPYDKNNLQSANNVISNTSKFSTAYEGSLHQFIKQLNLHPIRNVYIHALNLGNFNTIGSKGEQTIVKKIPVNANQSEMIFSDYNAGQMDALDCGKNTLRQIHFVITNVDGIEIPFYENHVSFSIVFN